MSDGIGFEKKAEKPSGTEIGSLADLGLGLIDSAVARPYNATIGLIAPKIDVGEYNHNSIAAKVGDFGGSIVDVVALSKVTGWGVGKGLGWGADRGLISASMMESPYLASTLSLGTTGALYGGVFTPGSATDRLKNATIGFATFGTMGASTVGLSRFGFLGQAGSRTFLQDVAMGGLSGIPAGLVDAETTSLVNGRGLTLDPTTLGKSALYYGVFGATMGGVAHGIAEGQTRAKSWLSDHSAAQGSEAPLNETRPAGPHQSSQAEVATTDNARVSPVEVTTTDKAQVSSVVNADAATLEPKPFNIPETGNIELGRMMREVAPADQIRLVQEVIASRPKVPIGSWMRLIEPQDMPTFLRSVDQMYPDTALTNAGILIDTRNLRPATPDSPAIDFKAWQQALETVKAEKPNPPKPASEAVSEVGQTAEKPFAFEDVTMSVRDPDQLKLSIAKNADTEFGSKVLNYANRWATIMEQKMAAGEPLTADMARQASLDTGMEVQNIEHDLARNVLIDTWKHGADLEHRVPSDAETFNAGLAAARFDGLTPAQLEEVNNFGGMLGSIANSRADAINIVRGADPANVDPAVRNVLLDHLRGSQTFLNRMGVDSVESVQSVVNAMNNVPAEDIPRFVHYADQFHHETFPNSVMSGMDQAVANGNIPPGTEQAWIDAISAKMRIVFPGIKESEWAISKLVHQ